MDLYKDTPIYLFTTQKEFEQWLTHSSQSVTAIWIKFAKKDSGKVSISYDDALDSALCYGWIDGLKNAYDTAYYVIRFTPRKPKSIWSKRNREHVERLIKENRMTALGLKHIKSAKADGRWEAAYDGSSNIIIPDYFITELKKDSNAYAFFQTLSKTDCYPIAFRLQTAIKQETKQRRMKGIIEKLRNKQKIS